MPVIQQIEKVSSFGKNHIPIPEIIFFILKFCILSMGFLNRGDINFFEIM
jgi:hypothetical protein